MTAFSALVRPRIIVGLGNPGERYAETRHNAGFQVVDRVLAMLNKPGRREHRFDSQIVYVSVGGRELVFAKPQTFMNVSGPAVARIIAAAEAVSQELLVVYDCLDLPAGRIRIRERGSSGGHRGVESVILALGGSDFPRLRVGIGRDRDVKVVDYVLSGWTADEEPVMEKTIEAAAAAVLLAVQADVPMAMNRYNGWTAQEIPPGNQKPGG